MSNPVQPAIFQHGADMGVSRGTTNADVKVVVEFSNVEKTYADGTYALAPVDLRIHDQEFISFIGPSGCGKSTLLKLGANLMTPSNGLVHWWGGGSEKIGTEGCNLSFVFQQPTLMPWASIAENVSLPLKIEGRVPKKEAAARVEEALLLVGLDKFHHHLPRQLSGGMMMRASIARSLVTTPNMLFMDEPFGALDEFTRNDLDNNILSLWKERGLTVLFVTHSISEAVFLSTRIIVMSSRPGRVFSEVRIDEPYPRGEQFRTSSSFAEFCRQLSLELYNATHA